MNFQVCQPQKSRVLCHLNEHIPVQVCNYDKLIPWSAMWQETQKSSQPWSRMHVCFHLARGIDVRVTMLVAIAVFLKMVVHSVHWLQIDGLINLEQRIYVSLYMHGQQVCGWWVCVRRTTGLECKYLLCNSWISSIYRSSALHWLVCWTWQWTQNWTWSVGSS